MSLTSKQRAALRGMANTMEPVFQIGKGEIDETLIKGVDDCIKFAAADISAMRTKSLSGVMVTNPPYGERIGDRRGIEKIYEAYRRFFGENPTWSLFVVTADKSIEKALGRSADRRRKLYNGRLEVCYYQFHGEKV
mgnify:FL=1